MTKPLGLIPSDFERFESGDYAGRTIILEKPKWDPNGILVRYELTGRSEGSRSREMFLNSYDNKRRINHGLIESEKDMSFGKLLGDVWLTTSPLKEPTEYEKAYQIYEAARIMDGRNIIISNGHHTDNLVGMSRRDPLFYQAKESYLNAALSMWGAETDGPNKVRQTSRIAAIVNKNDDGVFEAVLGSVDKHWNVRTFPIDFSKLKEGKNVQISTYSPDNPWMDIAYPYITHGFGIDKSLSLEVAVTWQRAKEDRFVIERESQEEIPTLTSIGWLYISSDGECIFKVKDAYNSE